MFRKISIILLSVILIFNLGAASFAQEFEESEVLKLPERSVGEMIEIPLGEAKYIEKRSGELIDVTDLLSFDTEDEANAYVEMIKAELNNPAQHKTDSLIVPMSTNGDILVDQDHIYLFAYINLRVAYSTSGDNNTGYITYHNAYTTFTGLTYGYDWNEASCYSQIASGGKDIYAAASGVLDYYFLVNGMLRFYSEQIYLSGYAYVIR